MNAPYPPLLTRPVGMTVACPMFHVKQLASYALMSAQRVDYVRWRYSR